MTVNTLPKFYPGSPSLRNAGWIHEYSKEELEEIKKCQNDCLYFIKNYVKIRNKDLGEIFFNPYPFQEKIIKTLEKNRLVIGKIPRQSGKTTIVGGYLLWMIIFHPHKVCGIAANLEKIAIKILTDIKKMYEGLPFWLMQGISKWNEKEIELENGSMITVSATTPNAFRSYSLDVVFVDEVAFIEKNMFDEFYASVFPTISSGKTTRMIMISTPKGMNHFYHLWRDAENKNSGFVPVSANWWEVPGRDQAWADAQLKELKEVKFNAEVLCLFQGSTNTLISGKCLAMLSAEPPIGQNDNLTVYATPEPDRTYLLSIDPSDGTNRDYSTMIILDITEFPLKICAIYRNNRVSPIVFGDIIQKVAKAYNEAHILIENNIGGEIGYSLKHDHECENLVYEKDDYEKVGIRMTQSVKRNGCNNLRDLIEDEKIVINDNTIISELSTFVQKKNSFQAEDGEHDDTVMALVLAAHFTTTEMFNQIKDETARSHIRERHETATNNALSPLGFVMGSVITDNNGAMRNAGYQTRSSLEADLDLPPDWFCLDKH